MTNVTHLLNPSIPFSKWVKNAFPFSDPEFRGCADAQYVHENKCVTEIQAVTVIDNQKHADVEVELCYCSEDKCNEERNFGVVPQMSIFLVVASTLVISTLNL